MSTYHYQCQHCYCTTSMWEVEDGEDSHYGGAIEDCGCTSHQGNQDDDDD